MTGFVWDGFDVFLGAKITREDGCGWALMPIVDGDGFWVFCAPERRGRIVPSRLKNPTCFLLEVISLRDINKITENGHGSILETRYRAGLLLSLCEMDRLGPVLERNWFFRRWVDEMG